MTAAAMKMLKDRNPEVRGAACSFLAAFSSAHDGARHVLEAADGSVFERLSSCWTTTDAHGAKTTRARRSEGAR